MVSGPVDRGPLFHLFRRDARRVADDFKDGATFEQIDKVAWAVKSSGQRFVPRPHGFSVRKDPGFKTKEQLKDLCFMYPRARVGTPKTRLVSKSPSPIVPPSSRVVRKKRKLTSPAVSRLEMLRKLDLSNSRRFAVELRDKNQKRCQICGGRSFNTCSCGRSHICDLCYAQGHIRCERCGRRFVMSRVDDIPPSLKLLMECSEEGLISQHSVNDIAPKWSAEELDGLLNAKKEQSEFDASAFEEVDPTGIPGEPILAQDPPESGLESSDGEEDDESDEEDDEDDDEDSDEDDDESESDGDESDEEEDVQPVPCVVKRPSMNLEALLQRSRDVLASTKKLVEASPVVSKVSPVVEKKKKSLVEMLEEELDEESEAENPPFSPSHFDESDAEVSVDSTEIPVEPILDQNSETRVESELNGNVDGSICAEEIVSVVSSCVVDSEEVSSELEDDPFGWCEEAPGCVASEEDVEFDLPRDFRVGGAGTCWRLFWWLGNDVDGEDISSYKRYLERWKGVDEHKTLRQIREETLRVDPDRKQHKNLLVEICRDPDGDYHLIRTLRELPDFIKDSSREQSKGTYISFYKFIDSALARSDEERWLGSSKEIIESAVQTLGIELARAKAQQQFDADYQSIPKIPYRMKPAELRRFEKYVDSSVMSTQAVASTSDHLFLQGARYLLREELRRLIPHNQDVLPTLHVGSTVQELKSWYSHKTHDFSFHLGEDKDRSRIHDELSTWVGNRLKEERIPALGNIGERTVKLRFPTMDSMMKLISVGEKRRLYVGNPALTHNRKYERLMFEDCLYSMSKDDFLEVWETTQAKVGFATIFIPDKMITNDAEESSIYNYRKYLPVMPDVEEFIETVWPTCLAFTPLIPQEVVSSALHKVFDWLHDKSWDFLQTIWDSWNGSEYPLDLILGNAFDVVKLGPIVRQVLHKYIPSLLDKYARLSITWKHGHSNGYDHKYSYWREYLNSRISNGRTTVDSEVVSRRGEMYLLRFWKSDGAGPILTNICLPFSRRIVWVADIESAYDPILKLRKDDVKYIPVNQEDWFKLLNWCMDQPVESLDFATVSTTLNRIRGGLSLGSRRLVEEMSIDSKSAATIALSCLMEAFNRHNIIADIESNPALKDVYECKGDVFLEKLAKLGLTLASGGLAIPVYWLFRWLVSSEKRIEFVKYPAEPKVSLVKSVRKVKNLQKEIANTPVTVEFPSQETKKSSDSGCTICDLYSEGHFSQDGNPAKGQFPRPLYHVPSKHDRKFEAEEMTTMLQTVRNAEASHGQAKVVPFINKFKHYLENFLTGTDVGVDVQYIMGGPGTGKSVILRKLAHLSELEGNKTLITVPFNALQADYIACDLIGLPGKHTFEVKTFWYSLSAAMADVWLVDEVSCVDWDLTLMMAKYLGVKKLYIAGDNKQGAIRPEAGEGASIFDRIEDLTKLNTHELTYNYRLDAWRVKWENYTYDYKMIPKRSDHLPPKVISVDEYRTMEKVRAHHKEMVFSHASSEPVFGVVSDPHREEGNNLSVRSAQGKTCDTAAVAVLEEDRTMFSLPSLLNVANSRSKFQTYYVMMDPDGDMAQDLKIKLHIHSQEAIDLIANKNLPKIDFDIPVVLTRRQALLSEAMQSFVDTGNLEYEEVVTQFEPDDSAPPLEENVGRSWVYDQFQLCMVDEVLKARPELEPAIRGYLLSLYNDDGRMGRIGVVGSLCRYVTSGEGALPVVDGKPLLPVESFLSFLSENSVGCIAYRHEQTNPFFISNYSRTNCTHFVFHIKDNHATLKTQEQVQVVSGSNFINQPIYTRLPNRQLVCELPKKGGRYILAGEREECREAEAEAYERVLAVAFEEFHRLNPTVYSRKDSVSQHMLKAARFLTGRFENYAGNVGWEPLKEEIEKTLDWRKRPWSAEAREESDRSRGDPRRKIARPGYWKRIPDVDVGHEEEEDISFRWPYRSAFMKDPAPEPIPDPITSKARFGKNNYLHASLIDRSGAYQHQRLNFEDTFGGVQDDLDLDVNVESLWFGRTRAKKIRRLKRRRWRQVAPGMANHFEDNPIENILTSTRYAKVKHKPKPLTNEAKKFVEEQVEATFRDKWKQEYVLGDEEANFIVHSARVAAKQRNYWKRGREARKKWNGHTLIFAGKQQVKPEKNGVLKLDKVGQGLMQSPPDFNNHWIGWSRMVNFVIKDRAKDFMYFDDRERESDFRTRLTAAIQALPGSPGTGMVDAKEFDAQQGPITVYAENLFMRKLGFSQFDIDEFQELRKPASFVAPGQFKGRHKGQKGSGLLDTKSMNTVLEQILTTNMFTGVGPRVDAGKGDDALRVQNGLAINHDHKKKVQNLIGMNFVVDVSQKGGEFIGCTVSKDGMYPSVTRVAKKVIAAHIRDEKHLQEYQKSLRHSVEEWKKTGIEDVIAYSAAAEGETINSVEACVGFVDSFSKISWDQYVAASRKCESIGFTLPSLSEVSSFVV